MHLWQFNHLFPNRLSTESYQASYFIAIYLYSEFTTDFSFQNIKINRDPQTLNRH